MSYSANYVDEHGKSHIISVSDSESREALKNDYNTIIKKYNPEIVTIERLKANPGEELHMKITVNAPSHYLVSQDDTKPKPCNSTSFEIIVYLGYPLKSISAFYPKDRYLASPNVFRSGVACIDHWIPLVSSLVTVVEKLIMDVIHNSNVTRYDSMANPTLEKWHKEGVAEKRFPTMNLSKIYTPAMVPLPSRSERIISSDAPPLPRRNRTNA